MVHAATNFRPEDLMRLRTPIVCQVCEAGDSPVVHTGGPGCRLCPPCPRCFHTGTDMHLSRHTAASLRSTCTYMHTHRPPNPHSLLLKQLIVIFALLLLIRLLTLLTASSTPQDKTLVVQVNVLGHPGRRKPLASLRCRSGKVR